MEHGTLTFGSTGAIDGAGDPHCGSTGALDGAWDFKLAPEFESWLRAAVSYAARFQHLGVPLLARISQVLRSPPSRG